MSETQMQMIETLAVPDIFTSGLGEVEDLGGGCWRFTFYARQHIGGCAELVVVARLVAPLDAVGQAILMAAKAVGFTFAKEAGHRLLN